ncbi:hypothetical protein F5I97DRAFT_1817307 [Phlebopus sp. FC_14]|nr:hypothetical protein F5I97DRAFT_1817307 [Phlebopus sp. FC_14]
MSPSYPDNLFFTALSVGATWFYVSRQHAHKNLTGRLVTSAVILHTLYVLCCTVLDRPPNLFSRLSISINTPADRVRALLLKEAGFYAASTAAVAVPPEIPKDIELLLSRLTMLDSRSLFARFGQRAMQTCQFCSSAVDYALFTFSSILTQYLRTATLLIFLTTTMNGRQRLRTIVLGALTCALLAEVYVLTSASAKPFTKDAGAVFMWYDNLFLARHALFLVLPLLTQALPPIYPPVPPSVALAPALAHLEHALPRAHLLKYTRQAIMRRPEMRDRAVEWWAREAFNGKAAREDAVVQRTAQKLGFDFATADGQKREGKMRTSAKMAVESLKVLFEPPAT